MITVMFTTFRPIRIRNRWLCCGPVKIQDSLLYFCLYSSTLFFRHLYTEEGGSKFLRKSVIILPVKTVQKWTYV